MYNKKFWRDAGERALSTFAQAAGAVLVLSENVTSILHVNWLGALSAGVIAALLALLKAMAAASKSGTDSASLVTEPAKETK